jgi:hypothetical protein
MLKAIKADLNYDISHDNKNSGQALAQILAEKSNPVGDIGYFGVTFGMEAKAEGALEPYKPANWEQVAPALKDPDGFWTTIHSGTLGLFVNKDALGGKPVPACWKDLLKPDYKGMVGYLDPTSAAVGYVGAVAIIWRSAARPPESAQCPRIGRHRQTPSARATGCRRSHPSCDADDVRRRARNDLPGAKSRGRSGSISTPGFRGRDSATSSPIRSRSGISTDRIRFLGRTGSCCE